MSALRDAWRKNAPELAALFNGALPDFVLAARPRELDGGIPVFSYHLVHAATFEADLAFLRDNGYRTLSAREFVAALGGELRVPPRSVLLSFDDGPANFHAVALPLLRRYAARAVAFVAPGLHADEDTAPAGDRPMSWQELREVHDSGLVELQSHTLESRYVPAWPRPAALAGCLPRIEQARRRASALPFAEDLRASRELLETRLPGLTVDQLAFPQYLGNEAAVSAARALGFRACYWGLTPGRALNRPGESSFHVSRINDEFLRRLPGAGRMSLAALVRERLRRVAEARAWRQRAAAA